ARGNDLEVNVLRGKQLTNMRSSGKDDMVRLTTPMNLTLEKALSYINDDEVVEVTPLSLRMRKLLLDRHERKRASREKQDS
ncbi:MAG: translational GTPase TypA, partial [Rhizobiaceae bacterium]|nr:translational GTPase TypA [Rhizobiaceae bacterium]